MKILQLRSEFRDNGPGTQALGLARELRRRGHEVSFAASGGVMVPEIRESGFTFHEIETLAFDRRGPLDVLRTIRALRRLLVGEQFDIVHAHNAASVVLAAIAALSARFKVGLAQSVRGIELRSSHQWRNWIYKVNPAALLAVSDYTRRELRGFGVPDSKIHVTYNGANTDRFDPDTADAERIRQELDLGRGPTLVHVGNFSGWKGQDMLVRAVAALRDSYPDIRLVLVGQGPVFDSVNALGDELGVRDHLRLTGLRRDIPDLLAASDLYCQPSTMGEMFPNSIVEAMTMRKCWVGSDLSGLPELTQNGKTGRVVPPGDLDSLVQAIDDYLADPDELVARGIRARQFVDETLTIEKVADRVEAVYRSILPARSFAVPESI